MMKKYRTYLIDLGFGAIVGLVLFIWNITVQKGYESAGTSLGLIGTTLSDQNISTVLGFRDYLYGSASVLVVIFLGLFVYSRALVFRKNVKKFFILNFKWLPLNLVLLCGVGVVLFVLNFLAASIGSMFYLNDTLFALFQNCVYLFLSIPLVLFLVNVSYLVYIKDSIKLGIDEVFKHKWYFRLLKDSFVFLVLAMVAALSVRTGFYVVISGVLFLLFFSWQKEKMMKEIS